MNNNNVPTLSPIKIRTDRNDPRGMDGAREELQSPQAGITANAAPTTPPDDDQLPPIKVEANDEWMTDEGTVEDRLLRLNTIQIQKIEELENRNQHMQRNIHELESQLNEQSVQEALQRGVKSKLAQENKNLSEQLAAEKSEKETLRIDLRNEMNQRQLEQADHSKAMEDAKNSLKAEKNKVAAVKRELEELEKNLNKEKEERLREKAEYDKKGKTMHEKLTEVVEKEATERNAKKIAEADLVKERDKAKIEKEAMDLLRAMYDSEVKERTTERKRLRDRIAQLESEMRTTMQQEETLAHFMGLAIRAGNMLSSDFVRTLMRVLSDAGIVDPRFPSMKGLPESKNSFSDITAAYWTPTDQSSAQTEAPGTSTPSSSSSMAGAHGRSKARKRVSFEDEGTPTSKTAKSGSKKN